MPSVILEFLKHIRVFFVISHSTIRSFIFITINYCYNRKPQLTTIAQLITEWMNDDVIYNDLNIFF